MPEYSVIIPVYNRPEEIDELLNSLTKQSYNDFEVLIIEDGSTNTCDDIAANYATVLDVKYFFKENTGPGDSRNYGMDKAQGNYLIFFDSDCIIPDSYFEILTEYLGKYNYDAFGGADDAHASFTTIQKAINYTMTSFLTTGGVRKGKAQGNKYQPRSFNMGIRKSVIDAVGGFSDIHPGEDPDLSFRIRSAGFNIGAIPEAFVYHKRRIDFSKFSHQVLKFGMVRVILNKWYPSTWSVLFLLPSMFLLFSITSLVSALLGEMMLLYVLITYISILFVHAMIKSRSLSIALLVIPAVFIQFWWYGFGYLKSWFFIKVMGKNEREAFPDLFFKS